MKIFVFTGLCLGMVTAFSVDRGARAASFTVDTGDDDHDARPGDHRCATPRGACSLRAAIEEANADRGADTVTFRRGIAPVIVLRDGQLEVARAGALRIRGPGAADLALDGNGATRLLFVEARARVTVSGLTLRHGWVDGDDPGRREFGGAIVNLGRLTLAGVTVSGSSARAGGGGIMNEGTLVLFRSTVTANSTGNLGGGILNIGRLKVLGGGVDANQAAAGGGIDNRGSAMLRRAAIRGNTSTDRAAGVENRGTLTVDRSTISGNRGIYDTGGIENLAALTLTRTAIGGNEGAVAGGVYGARGEMTIANSVIADNLGPSGPSDPNADCALDPLGTFHSRGHNRFGQEAGCIPARTTEITTAATSPQIALYAGYYDTHHGSHTKPKPSPWKGSSGVVFLGQSDPGGGWDTAALRIDNLTGGSISVAVTVDIGSKHFALWSTSTILAGGRLIVAQTAKENFDGSDTNPAGCYGCSASKCTSDVRSTVPVVHVTIGSQRFDYYDTAQVLNTRGVDAAGCPYTGTRNDESETWQHVG